MAVIRDAVSPANILKVNADGSLNANVVLAELEVKNDAGNPLSVSDGGGSITVDGTVSASQSGSWTVAVSGTVQANQLVGSTAVSNANPMPISDAGGSVTVDGTVTVAAITNPLPAGANSIGNIGTVATITNPVAVNDNGGSLTVDGTITANQGTAGASPWPVSDGGGSLTVDGTVNVGNFPATQSVNLSQVNGAANSPTNVIYTVEPPVTAITVTGAAAAAVTLTIPAPSAGQFIYLMGYEILLLNTAARATATATLITVTTTNLGSLSWSYGSPVTALGSSDRTVAMSMPAPLKAAVSGTACTIVAPATTGVLWMLKAFYYVAP